MILRRPSRANPAAEASGCRDRSRRSARASSHNPQFHNPSRGKSDRLLDTGVARELCYSEPDWFPAFVEMKAGGWTFHLSEICVAEIIATRERGSITEDEWQQGVERIDKILGRYFPCLPGKRELFHLCGFFDAEDPNLEHLTKDFQVRYSRAIWKTLKQPLRPENHNTEIVFSVGGQKFRCPIKAGVAAKVLENERKKWIKEMKRPPKRKFNYDRAVA